MAWTDLAASLRLAATVALWRQIVGQELQGQTDVRNISLFTNLKDIIDHLELQLQTNDYKKAIESRAAGEFRGTDVFRGTFDPRHASYQDMETIIFARVSRDLDLINAIPFAPENKSVPTVDRTLKKLAGYMTANGIEFVVP